MPPQPAPIDGSEVFKLAKLGCTQKEIGEYFGVDASTISRRFATEFHLGAAACKTSIRRWQIKKARGGCTPMLIHLGKTYLGQTDRVDVTTRGDAIQSRVIILPDNGRDPVELDPGSEAEAEAKADPAAEPGPIGDEAPSPGHDDSD